MILSVALFVPAFLGAQASGTPAPEAPAASGGVQPVDETTLLLDGGGAQSATPSVATSPFGIWDLLRMILVLAAVIGVVYGLFYLLKRGSNGKFARSDAIRVLGSQPLPGNRSMYLVEVGSQVFLVGSGGDSLNLIAEITDKETVDAMVLRGGEVSAGSRKSFGELVSGMFRGTDGKAFGLAREQRERLQRLRQH